MHTYDATSIQPVAAALVAVSAGRLGAFLSITLALAGVVVGALALTRWRSRPATGTRARPRPDAATVATALGLTGTALGGLIAATADGGVGSGNGLGGAMVGLGVGLLATVLGGLALTRSRRSPAARATTTRDVA